MQMVKENTAGSDTGRWPFLTADIAAIPGAIKERNEDFQVDEIPAYEPCGEGDHVYIGIEKDGITTMRALKLVAKALGVKSRDMGMAGQKDARGITRQMISLEHIDPALVEALEIPRMKILWVKRHRNKLRVGHLRGNRFSIRLRDTDTGRIDDVRTVLDRLMREGAPNYFGPQRFGSRGDTWKVGRALLSGMFEEATQIICGRPTDRDVGEVLRARQLFDQGELLEAADAWPRGYGDSARLCRELARRPEKVERVVMSMDRRLLSLYVSAYQSYLFNQVVAHRIGDLGEMQLGDLAWKHDKGVVFNVEEPQVDSERAALLEISPSGPMYGQKMSWPEGEPGRFERELLEGEGRSIESFPKGGALRCAGGRRPLRFIPFEPTAEAGEDEHGEFIKVEFALPSGCYATVILGEVCKDLLQGA